MSTPYLPRSDVPAEYTKRLFLPNFIINNEFVLQKLDEPCDSIVQEAYTVTTTVQQRIISSNDVIVSDSRTIIDDVFMWSNASATLLLLFECAN